MTEQSCPFPLINLFQMLRRQGWVLGIDDYLSVLATIETGLSVADGEQLKQICTLLWAKTPEESRYLHQVWEQLDLSNVLKQKIADQSEDLGIDISEKEPVVSESKEKEYILSPDPVTKVQSERSSQPETLEIAESRKTGTSSGFPSQLSRKYQLRRDYFPLTQRQMKQSWRFLRRPIREGVGTELDVKATIKKVSQEGILTTPVLCPQRRNRADLILLIDQKGSMMPFHPLTRQLIETAQRDGKLRQTNVYYFHDCPDYDEEEESHILLEKSTLFSPISLKELSTQWKQRSVAMIISDGGAARGRYDGERWQQTCQFLAELTSTVRYCTWLNPMPNDDWNGTTAAKIAQSISMFSLSHQGFKNAIAVLQGKYLVGGIN